MSIVDSGKGVTSMDGENETKLHDRAKELFGAAWGSVVVAVLGALTATWFWVEYARTDGHLGGMQGPLTWCLNRLADLGIAQPDWLQSYAAWRPHGSRGGIEWALVAFAVCFSVKASLVKPGYLIVGELLLLSATEWFGVQSVVERYTVISLLLLAVASLFAVARWYLYRSGPVRTSGWFFTADTLFFGFLGGPVYLLVLGPLMPAVIAWNVLASFGSFSTDRDDPAAVELLREALTAIENHTGTLDELPASTHAHLKATIELVAADRASRDRSVSFLKYRLQNPPIRRAPLLVR